jgi:hypothetical protein
MDATQNRAGMFDVSQSNTHGFSTRDKTVPEPGFVGTFFPS